ncbi:MAG: DUF4395 family protein [Actinomycetota bacterium]
MVDSHLPRFAQAIEAAALAVAFAALAEWVVPVLGAVLLLAAVGGPRYNLFAHLYRALPIPPGEPEPAAPPRFSQTLGTVMLAGASVAFFALEARTTPWWVLGWGPAIVVAVLAALAATTSF